MDVWTTDVCMDNGWMDGQWMDGWMDNGWIHHAWMNAWMELLSPNVNGTRLVIRC